MDQRSAWGTPPWRPPSANFHIQDGVGGRGPAPSQAYDSRARWGEPGKEPRRSGRPRCVSLRYRTPLRDEPSHRFRGQKLQNGDSPPAKRLSCALTATSSGPTGIVIHHLRRTSWTLEMTPAFLLTRPSGDIPSGSHPHSSGGPVFIRDQEGQAQSKGESRRSGPHPCKRPRSPTPPLQDPGLSNRLVSPS